MLTKDCKEAKIGRDQQKREREKREREVRLDKAFGRVSKIKVGLRIALEVNE
jgi:hypothetical protein